MVKNWKKICFLLLFPAWLVTSAAQVHVEVDSELASEKEPLKGRLVVVHSGSETVDTKSVELKGKPLDVQLMSQTHQTSDVILNGKRTRTKKVVSYYLFEIEGQAKGVYQLPSIKVKVGKKDYFSSPISYEVLGTQTDNGFILKSEMLAPNKIYPGQRVTAKYRLFLKDQVEVTNEYYPLLELEGFEKIGERKVTQFRRGHLTIFELTQVLEAKKEGEYQVEAGFVEGLPFQQDFFFRKRYKKNKLRSTSEPFKYKIEAFPQTIQASSFSGAVGNIDLNLELLTASRVSVGDKISLKMTFKGTGLETLKLPHFSQQEAFNGKFRFSDLPSSKQTSENERVFYIDLRPMQEDITEIPSFHFTYFDPKTEKYETLTTEPIALEVYSLQPIKVETKPESVIEVEKSAPTEEAQNKNSLLEMDIVGPLQVNQTEITDYQSKSMPLALLWILPLLWTLQWALKQFLDRRKEDESIRLLKEALKYEKEPQKYLILVEKAFHKRLVEMGWLNAHDWFDALSHEGLNGEIKYFIEELHQTLFSQKSSFDFKKSQQLAKQLYRRIGEGK